MKKGTAGPAGQGRTTGSLILLILCMSLFVTAMSSTPSDERGHAAHEVIMLPFEQSATYTDVSKKCGPHTLGLAFSSISHLGLQKAVQKARHKQCAASLIADIAVDADQSTGGNPRLMVKFRDDIPGGIKVAINRLPGFNALVIDAKQTSTQKFDEKKLLFSAASLLRG